MAPTVDFLVAEIGIDDPPHEVACDADCYSIVSGRLDFLHKYIAKELCDKLVETGVFEGRDGFAIQLASLEAFTNAQIHGNLERSSSLREDGNALLRDLQENNNTHMHGRKIAVTVQLHYEDTDAVPQAPLQEKMVSVMKKREKTPAVPVHVSDGQGNLGEDQSVTEKEYEEFEADRFRIRVADCLSAVTQPSYVSFTITDEGPGFDLSKVPDPTAPENIEKASGRGLMLMNAYMSEVQYRGRGNEVLMGKATKRPKVEADTQQAEAQMV